MYFNYIERNYVVDSLSKESYSSTIRKRNFDIMRLNLQQCDKPIYLDLVNMVSAFKYVIDYKVSSELYVEQSRDEMVEEYTKEFIQCALDSLAHYGELLHFVKDTMELREALNDLLR